MPTYTQSLRIAMGMRWTRLPHRTDGQTGQKKIPQRQKSVFAGTSTWRDLLGTVTPQSAAECTRLGMRKRRVSYCKGFLSIKSTYEEQSRKGPRHNLLTFPEKSGKHPGLETPRLSFSQVLPAPHKSLRALRARSPPPKCPRECPRKAGCAWECLRECSRDLLSPGPKCVQKVT